MIAISVKTCLLLSTLFLAQVQPAREDDTGLRNAISPLVSNHRGDVAVVIEHLKTSQSFRYYADTAMPTASLIKLPLMVAVYDQVARGELDLTRPVALAAEDKVPGSGILTEHFSEGATLPLRDFVRLMMRDSDNTATNIVVDQVGLAATAELMESLGLKNTKLHSKVYRGDTSIFPERSQQFGIGSTTANEMVSLLRMLKEERLGDAVSTQQMLGHLAACDDRSKLARYLPTDVRLFHKTGAIGNCRTDAGIIETATGPVAVCVLTNRNADQSWSESNEAELLCSHIGRIIVERFGGDQPSSSMPLQRGATGPLVEALQRTLNARLDPPGNLSVDGDFGPATESAVKRFQQAHSLESSGLVDPATWQSLGPLVEETELDEAPEEFNARDAERARQPAPSSSDPPSVTCKAWIVADAETRAELAGWNAHEPRPPASTTKIMTALLVAELIAQDPLIADEIVTFSKYADDTIGSSCNLRAGEQVPVRELLYGLLLPSGNDAAIALAEHFGERMQSSLPAKLENPIDAFVARMNLRAMELGMNSTYFENPHGLTEPKHLSTAADLARLAFTASQDSVIRKIVSTRQHACTLGSVQGYSRNIVWSNTNVLLDIEGYFGMKTGTTDAAGACLVAMGTRAGKSRIVVTLGSSDSRSRIADVSNLFRWSLDQPPVAIDSKNDTK